MIFTNFDRFIFRIPSESYKKVIDFFNDEFDYEELLKDDKLKEAILITSESLYETAYKLKNKDLNTIKSIYKYFVRFTSRSTPFGLFAGLGVGDITQDTSIYIDIPNAIRRKTRLDMDYLCKLNIAILKDKHTKNKLRFFPNSTSYIIGNKLRHIEYRYVNHKREYRLSETELSNEIEKVLDYAQHGKKIDELCEVIDIEGINHKQKIRFINDLIENQYLQSELDPIVTGDSYFDFITNKLSHIESNYAKKLIKQLNKIACLLNDLDNGSDEFDDKYEAIKSLIDSIGVDYNTNYLFQTDLYFTSQNANLSSERIKDAKIGIDILSRFSCVKNKHVQVFKEAFLSRFENNYVPLIEVIDVEKGIGFPSNQFIGDVETSSIIKDFNYTPVAQKEPESESKFAAFWVKKFEEYIHQASGEIVLSDNDIKNFEPQTSNLPPTFSAMLSVINIEKQDHIILTEAGGNTALSLIGRFCLGNEAIHSLAQQISEYEKTYYDEYIIAEIAHLPEQRVGNILQRPTFFDYEINYLSNSQLPIHNQIPIEDLLVGVQNDEVILFSKKFQKRVIPRLSNAHNYQNNPLPVYYFLCSLQHQQPSAFYIDLGIWASNLRFFPRVKYKNIILRLATWKFIKNDLKEISNFDEFKNFCNSWKVPKYVAIIDEDNELVIDTESKKGYLIFSEYAFKSSNLELKEWLHFKENNYIESDRGYHINQFLVSFYKNKDNTALFFSDKFADNRRNFNLGSEWVYIKYYCGSHTADKILKFLYPKILLLEKQKFIKKWFFVRYNDPNHHIRVRLLLTNPKDIGLIITEMNSMGQTEQGLAWKIQYDTYEQETERYGLSSVVNAETLFFIDSKNYVSILLKDGLIDDFERWFLTIYNIDFWLKIFIKDIHKRADVVEKLRDAFYKEFEDDKEIKDKISKLFREYRESIESILLNTSTSTSKLFRHTQKLLNGSKNKIQREVDTIILKNEKPMLELLSSYLHMNINRWHCSSQRLNEYIIYEVLFRVYRSFIKRNIS